MQTDCLVTSMAFMFLITLLNSEGGVGKISCLLALSVNISKTAADTAKVTIND